MSKKAVPTRNSTEEVPINKLKHKNKCPNTHLHVYLHVSCATSYHTLVVDYKYMFILHLFLLL